MSDRSTIEKALIQFGLSADAGAKRLLNGVNSNVYIISDNGKNYILKFYRVDKNAPTRLEREVTALKLFHENGISNVPLVVGYSAELNCALISYIESSNVTAFRSEYIPHFISFFSRLLALSKTMDRHSFPMDAIDSCMNVDTVIQQVEQRLVNLTKENNAQINGLLLEIGSFFQTVLDRVRTVNPNAFNDLVPMLSTVDFGINNVLIRDERLYFIDFEFFGWDNPVHLISDTISHPANGLDLEQQSSFLDKILECYTVSREKEALLQAFNGVNLIFDIKWCLIMLNPFLSSYNSNGDPAEMQARKDLQEKKVINKLELIKHKMQNAKFFN